MSVSELPIPIDRERIAAFCRERGIRRLSLFGSVLRDDFDAERSDVDVLAEYESGALKGLGWDTASLRTVELIAELDRVLHDL